MCMCASRQVLQARRLMSRVKKVIATLVVDLHIRYVGGKNGAWRLEEGALLAAGRERERGRRVPNLLVLQVEVG